MKRTDRDRLRRLRLQREMSYEALAEDIGVAPQTLWNYLQDRGEASELTRYKIAQYVERNAR